MPLLKGYSYDTVQRNIAHLVASGMERGNAVATAKSAARAAFFKRFKTGAIPLFLTYPGSGRLASYYTPDGKPARKNPSKRKSAKRADIARASKLIEDFSGHKARELGHVEFPKNPGVAVAIGNVIGISYETKRDGVVERYYHKFTRKHSRPLLVTSQDGKQLYLLGGAYDFTELGIVDRK